jgi:hypothetical protein
MPNYRALKRRPPESVHEAMADAFAQLEGGVSRAATVLNLSRGYVNAMADADAEGRKRANVTLQQAGLLAREGATALADWLAREAGGTFVPHCEGACALAVQDAVAAYSKESGEAISAAILAALSGMGQREALREIDEAAGLLARLRSQVAASNVTPIKGKQA